MIIDSHLHIFPFLDGPCGFATRDEHLQFLQAYVVGHSQPARRVRDDAIVPGGSWQLADPERPGPDGLVPVDFRVGANGRFLWTQDGEDRYIHFMPPSLQANACPAEAVLAQMAYVGIDVGVLQNAHLYGRLNDDFADAMRRYPEKFIGLAEIDEARADQPSELEDLREAARGQGLRGLYYANRGLLWDPRVRPFDAPCFEPLWDLVAELKLPVFWELFGIPAWTNDNFLIEIDRLVRWQARHPAIRSILTHGLYAPHVLAPPEPIARLFTDDRISVELLYPIGWGRSHVYPYAELRPVIRELYRRVGASRLCWGSDLPNVERNCTYRQSLDYLPQIADFIPPSNLDRILGDNLAELFGLSP